MLDKGPNDRSGHLRTKRQTAVAAIGKRIHFLADDIATFADTAGEQGGVLKGRCDYPSKLIVAEDVPGPTVQPMDGRGLLGQIVLCSPRRLKFLRFLGRSYADPFPYLWTRQYLPKPRDLSSNVLILPPADQERVLGAFPPDSRRRTMPGEDIGLVGQHHDLAVDRLMHLFIVAARKIRAADRVVKDEVPAEEIAFNQQRDPSGGVPGGVDNAQLQGTDSDGITRDARVGGPAFASFKDKAGKILVRIRQILEIIFMDIDLGARCLDHLGDSPDVVPMAVR